MFVLKLLGGASLESPTGPITGRATQRRRLALLAMLALARSRGLRRDKLIALLWPEQDSEQGRHHLSDSIYRVNQALGAEAIVSTGDDVRLARDVLPSDVDDFESAVERGEWETAARTYTGPFLDGFFLSDAEEFERWADGERARLAQSYARSVESLAEDAERRGDHTTAVRWWRTLAAHDPYSSRVAVRLMRALDRAGDRAAALQHARVHATLLADEFGTEPDTAVSELATSLRAQPLSVPAMPVPVQDDARRVTPPETADRTETKPPSRQSARWRRHALRAALVLVPLALIAILLRDRAHARPDAASIAVLPFADLSPGGDHEYFSDGITEELINSLGRVEGVRVAARSSAFAFKGRPTDIRDVGERLGVATVLEGSVRTSDSTMRITARLSNARDGYQLWSRTWDRTREDVFAVQEEIARSIVETLKGTLLASTDSAATARREVNLDAYTFYLRGRHAWYRRTEAGLRLSAWYFSQAIGRDSAFALAHAGLADALAVLGFYDILPPREAFPAAERAAHSALARDSTLVQPLATLGYVELYYHWRWPAAEEWFRRAIARAPQFSTAHQWFGNYLTARARFAEAERAIRRAQETDPLSLVANAALGWVQYYAGEYARAAESCRLTLELDPTYAVALLWRGWALEAMGNLPEALTTLRRAVDVTERSALVIAALARAEALSGDQAGARALLRELETRAASGYVSSYDRAKVYLALGERDRALQLLERAHEERSHSMALLGVDPQLAPLHGDERYEALVRRVGAARRGA